MRKKIENRHMVDVLFVLTLFCLFVISSMLLIVLGANIYKKTIDNMDTHFNKATSISYITEKVRQSDIYGKVQAGQFCGEDALIIQEEYNDKIYFTYLYSYDGYLKELFTLKDSALSLDSGQDIIPLNDFKIKTLSYNLYRIILTDKNNHTVCMTINSKCNE